MDLDLEDEELTPRRSNQQSQRIQKLRHLTGRTESIFAIKDFLNPETLEEAAKSREMIESSDRLKKKLGERPPNMMLPKDREGSSTLLNEIMNSLEIQPSLSPSTSSPPSLIGTRRRNSTTESVRKDVVARRNSVDFKATNKRRNSITSPSSKKTREPKEVREDQEGLLIEHEEHERVRRAEADEERDLVYLEPLEEEDGEKRERREDKEVRRLQKLRQLTGRDKSLMVIEDLIAPESKEQALEHGKTLEKREKMKKVFGERALY